MRLTAEINLVLYLGIRNTSLCSKYYQTRCGKRLLYLCYTHILTFSSKNARNISNFCSAKWFTPTFQKESVFKATHTVFMLWLAPELEEEELLFKEHCISMYVILHRDYRHSGANERFLFLDYWKLIFSKLLSLWAQVSLVKLNLTKGVLRLS